MKNQVNEFGQVLWRQTSMMDLQFPFGRAVGKWRTEGRIYYMRGKQCIFRPYRVPRNPRTPVQTTRRQAWGAARGAWSVLPADVRDAWFKYGRRYFDRLGQEKNIGQNAFITAQLYRISVGWGVLETAPVLAPPVGCTGLEQLPSGSDAEFRFRVKHTDAAVAGCKILVCITPAMPTTRRRPRSHELRWVGGEGSGSFVDLPPSGGVVTIPAARFAIAPGQRFGLSVRVINPEGTASRALKADWIRLPHEVAAGSGSANDGGDVADGTDRTDGNSGVDGARRSGRSRAAVTADVLERLWTARHADAPEEGNAPAHRESRWASPCLFAFTPLPGVSPHGSFPRERQSPDWQKLKPD